MAVKRIARGKYIGLSTDTKPTDDIQEGSTFHAVDTGAQYVFYDGTWEEDLRLVYTLKHG